MTPAEVREDDHRLDMRPDPGGRRSNAINGCLSALGISALVIAVAVVLALIASEWIGR